MFFLRNGKTESNYDNVLSDIATPLLLIAQSNLKYPCFPKSQQVIGTNREICTRDFSIFLFAAGARLK